MSLIIDHLIQKLDEKQTVRKMLKSTDFWKIINM